MHFDMFTVCACVGDGWSPFVKILVLLEHSLNWKLRCKQQILLSLSGTSFTLQILLQLLWGRPSEPVWHSFRLCDWPYLFAFENNATIHNKTVGNVRCLLSAQWFQLQNELQEGSDVTNTMNARLLCTFQWCVPGPVPSGHRHSVPGRQFHNSFNTPQLTLCSHGHQRLLVASNNAHHFSVFVRSFGCWPLLSGY